jgi:hypothetical protein
MSFTVKSVHIGSRQLSRRIVLILPTTSRSTEFLSYRLLPVEDIGAPIANGCIGFYRDVRSGQDQDIDCSKVIWILATNKGDKAIAAFHAREIAPCKDEDIQNISLKSLQINLKKDFMRLYSVKSSPSSTSSKVSPLHTPY